MARTSIRAAFATAAVAALMLSALVAGPVAAAGSVTVHVGCPGGVANMNKLVQAVSDANSRAPKTTILYLTSGCNYAFYRAHSFPVDGVRANALPVIRSHIVIHGQGATLSRRDGTARFRLIAVDTMGNLSIDHLTLSNGRARNGLPGTFNLGSDGTAGTDGRDGGAIYNVGKLTLDNVTLDNNQAGNGGNGGGSTGFAGLSGAPGVSGEDAAQTIGGNAGAGGRGGAIYSSGTLTITNSALTNNRAGNGGKGGDAAAGAGGNGGSGNPGGNGGSGGAATGGNGGPGGYGGAIYSSGVLSVSNSTLDSNGTGNGGNGGTATGGAGGHGADNFGIGGNGGSANTLAASGGTGTAIYQWGGHADILSASVTNNSGGNGGGSTSTGGNGGDGGCSGNGGNGGNSGAGGGNAGTDPLRADNGATLTTSGTTQSGNADGVPGGTSSSAGIGGSGGVGCT